MLFDASVAGHGGVLPDPDVVERCRFGGWLWSSWWMCERWLRHVKVHDQALSLWVHVCGEAVSEVLGPNRVGLLFRGDGGGGCGGGVFPSWGGLRFRLEHGSCSGVHTFFDVDVVSGL